MKKRKIRVGRLILLIIIFLALAFLLALIAKKIFKKEMINIKTGYVASQTINAPLYDKEYNEVETIIRGTEIKYIDKLIENEYYEIENKNLYILKQNITDTYENVVLEKEKYVRTPVTIYKEKEGSKIESYAPKGTQLEIIGFDKLEEGKVNKYKIKYNEIEGYVFAKYLVNTQELALVNYDNGFYSTHSKRTNYYDKSESAGSLDYYPREKGNFENNVMPKVVNALYLSMGDIGSVDSFIELAKNTGVNAFVVDIKDGQLAYQSKVAKEYSPKDIG